MPFSRKQMEESISSFSFITEDIENHMKERSRLEAQLKEVERKSAVAEKGLKSVEKEHAEVKMEGVRLREKKQLLLNKLQLVNTKNDSLHRAFAKNQKTESELQEKLTKSKAQLDSDRSHFNGEYLKLQNPLFTELGIPETKDFELPSIELENLQSTYQAIQQSI